MADNGRPIPFIVINDDTLIPFIDSLDSNIDTGLVINMVQPSIDILNKSIEQIIIDALAKNARNPGDGHRETGPDVDPATDTVFSHDLKGR